MASFLTATVALPEANAARKAFRSAGLRAATLISNVSAAFWPSVGMANAKPVGGQRIDRGRAVGGVQARLGRQPSRVEPDHGERHRVG